MAGPARRRRFLFISNGHGEDWIAAAILRALPMDIAAEAYPMIGAGDAYHGLCPLVGPRARLPSQGWRNVKGSLRRDVMGGGLGAIPPALSFLSSVRGHYDRVVVVGDMVGVLFAFAAGHRGLFYIDVYKTGAARLYSAAERMAIKRACATVFCRAPNLARLLSERGIDARAAGNVMMDAIPFAEYDATARRTRPRAVTLLPGSRALTGESFALQIEALRALPPELAPDVFLAVAGGIDTEALARTAGLVRLPVLSAEGADLGQMGDEAITVHMARGAALGNLLMASDVVLSQAGTASVQALGLGRPVITFVQKRDRLSRVRDEQALFGEARTICEPTPRAVGGALAALLADPARRDELGAVGRARIGGPGALAAILEALAA